MKIENTLIGTAHKLGAGQHRVQCPFCSSTRRKKGMKDLSLNIEKEHILYNCHHCLETGKIKLELHEIKTRRKPMQLAVKHDYKGLSDNAIAWLNSRGISEETANKAKLKTSKTYIRAVNAETECVVFPYTNQGQQYAAKIRSLSDKGFSCNGSPQSFFNIDNVATNDDLIICEGEMDALSFMEAGYDSVVSVPNGAVMKVVDADVDPEEDNKFKFLWDAKKKIDLAAKIIIATDHDSAGQAMAEEIARRIGKDRCWKIEFPEDCKDANDVLVKHGKKKLDDITAFCKPWPVAGLYDASHFYKDLDEIYVNGIGSGAKTGYPNVDELYSVVEGQLTVVTGHPSSGKSEFIDQIMINLASREDWKFGICSFENEPRIHIAKLISKYLEKPFFDGMTPRMTKSELERGKAFIQSHFSFVYQADGSMATVEGIIERLKVAVMRNGIKGAIIDPYNYIAKSRDISETDWISDMLTKLRVFAQSHGIHLWFVAHPTKMMRDQNGKIPAPKGYDISGSAAWFAKADVGLTVHRPDPNKTESQIHIWKCRFSWVGQQGQASLYFNPVTSTYTHELDDPFSDMPEPQYDATKYGETPF